ncbi:MAG: hypothetical protein ACLPN5_20990 [Roseiarcus sp.]
MKEEIRRLKRLLPRASTDPLPIEKTSDRSETLAAPTAGPGARPLRRGRGVSKLKVVREAPRIVPPGALREGDEDIVPHDVLFGPFATRFRREREEAGRTDCHGGHP